MNYLFFLLVVVSALIFPRPAEAHAFGQMYTLPLPAWLYIYGGAAALLVSFLLIAFFVGQKKEALTYPQKTYPVSPHVADYLKIAFKTGGFILFLVTVLTGFIGVDDATQNINMTLFWVIFLLGLTYLVALVGDIWPFLNPWATLMELLERRTSLSWKGTSPYPTWLSYWPAIGLYLLLIWEELLGVVTPLKLSIGLTIYTLLTLLASYRFGKDVWLRYGEVFSVLFRVIGKIAPLAYMKRKIELRPPFVGIFAKQHVSSPLLFFILCILAGTAYDGFRATTAWVTLYYLWLQPVDTLLGSSSYTILQTLSLLVFPVMFCLFYLAAIFLMKLITQSKRSVLTLAQEFSLSLIPIAFVYNIAHYYTLLVIQGQDMFHLISDPLGVGWNLFGTGHIYPNVSLIPSNIIWDSQVGVIVFGHIVSVYLAHRIALVQFSDTKKVLLSQLPMLILMMFYTMFGLWILSQPLSVGG